jgi:hypothetical protein
MIRELASGAKSDRSQLQRALDQRLATNGDLLEMLAAGAAKNTLFPTLGLYMGWTSTNFGPKILGRGGVQVQFTVGLKQKEKMDRIAVDAEDALIAALKVKTERPEAVITYVRQQNRRGDARHPSHALVESPH